MLLLRQQSNLPVSTSIFGFLFNNLKYETISEEDYLSEIINNDLDGLDSVEDDLEDTPQENEALSNDENENLSVSVEGDFKTRKVKINDKLGIDEKTNKFFCSLCNYSSRYKYNVVRHYTLNHSKPGFKVDSKRRKMRSGIRKERPYARIDETTNQIFCRLCNYNSKRFSNVLRHYNSVHVRTAESGYVKCPKCDIKLHSSELEAHSCVLYPCDICGKQFNSIINVANHKRNTHTDLGTLKCELCGKLCKSKEYLRRHYGNYHGDKIPCQICGAEFTSTYYKSHLKTHDEKTVCNICNKEVSKTGLKEHMRRKHTKDEEKMFQCPDCGKGFTKLYALDKHKMNVHLKLRPYKCRYGCTFAYNDISNRNAHERKTHGGLFQPNSKLNDEN